MMQIQEIFLAALEIDDLQQRAAYVAQACVTDRAVHRKVNALLAAHERSGEFLDVPALQQIAEGQSPNQETDRKRTLQDEIDLAFLQPSTKPDSLGRLLHYEVQEVVGRGGCGIVLKAFDERLHRIVAIKIMTPELAATSPARKRFLREARATAAIRHENVVSIYAVEEKPLPFLVMEFIDGQTLHDKISEIGPLEIKEVVTIGQQVARGLQAAHAQGLIHRDIKPANILLEKGTDRPKITDFGLARSAEDASLTQSGAISGTPLYMSPEQAQGLQVDHRSDLFSLGSVLYMMCSGRPPFRAATAIAVLKRVVEDQPRPIREIIPETPEWLIGIIARLHTKKPGDRFASAQEVGDMLAQCQSRLLMPDLPFPDTKRLSRQQFLRAGAVLASAFVICIGLSEAAGVTKVGNAIIRLLSTKEKKDLDNPDTNAMRDGQRVVGSRQESTAVTSAIPQNSTTVSNRSPVHFGDGDRQGRYLVDADGLTQTKVGQSLLLFGKPEWTDYDLSVEMRTVPGRDDAQGGSLVFRAESFDNQYALTVGNFGGKIIDLTKLDNDRWSRLGNYQEIPFERDRWYRLDVQLRGPQIRCSVDGQQVYNLQDESHLTGMIGLGTWNSAVTWRNLRVASPDGTILWEGFPEIPSEMQSSPDRHPSNRKPFHIGYVKQSRYLTDAEGLTQTNVGKSLLLFGNPEWTDYDISVETKTIPGAANADSGSLIFRAASAINYYYLAIASYGGKIVDLETFTNGQRLRVGNHHEKPFEYDRWYRLDVQLRGAHIRCSVDGQQVYDLQDESHPAGMIGLSTWNSAVKWRNLRVTSSDGTVLWEGFPEIPSDMLSVPDRRPAEVVAEKPKDENDPIVGKWDGAIGPADPGLPATYEFRSDGTGLVSVDPALLEAAKQPRPGETPEQFEEFKRTLRSNPLTWEKSPDGTYRLTLKGGHTVSGVTVAGDRIKCREYTNTWPRQAPSK